MRFLSQVRPAQAVVKIRPGPGKSVKLREKKVGAATAATTGEAEPGGAGRLHLPPASLAPVLAELFGIISVISIKYPKMNYFPKIGSRQANPPSHPAAAVADSGRFMRVGRWKNGFLVILLEVKGLDEEENILCRPWHDKMNHP
jgi:hypothetical protein